jgi:D-psicose/D-tagatose/L-ribulose 3-epimerase
VNRRHFIAIGAATALAQSCALDLRFGVAQFDQYDPLVDVDQLAALGFDYIEPAVFKVMERTDAQFESARGHAKTSRIHVEAMNSFIPSDLKVVGPKIDQPRLRDYVQKSLARAEQLGAKIVVFGSGAARTVPDGFSHEGAWQQLQEFLRMAGDEIVRNKYGITIGIEALRKAESNIVNTSADAYKLARETNHPKVRMIVDFFHLATEMEDPAILQRAKDFIIHLHFSNPDHDRVFPRDTSEYAGYPAFFDAARKIGYKGRLSLEAHTKDFLTDARIGLAVVRNLQSTACRSVPRS